MNQQQLEKLIQANFLQILDVDSSQAIPIYSELQAQADNFELMIEKSCCLISNKEFEEAI